jgi:hypothetical protein
MDDDTTLKVLYKPLEKVYDCLKKYRATKMQSSFLWSFLFVIIIQQYSSIIMIITEIVLVSSC